MVKKMKTKNPKTKTIKIVGPNIYGHNELATITIWRNPKTSSVRWISGLDQCPDGWRYLEDLSKESGLGNLLGDWWKKNRDAFGMRAYAILGANFCGAYYITHESVDDLVKIVSDFHTQAMSGYLAQKEAWHKQTG